MKLFVLVTVFAAACSSTEIPQVPGDNSHYIAGVSRYIWMPDDKGTPHLVDLQEPVQQSPANSANTADPEYLLYTRRNPTEPQIIRNARPSTVRQSNYDGAKPVIVIVHGWRGSRESPVNLQLTEAFLEAVDCNVIVVDWSAVTESNYLIASDNVVRIGRAIGYFFMWLSSTAGVSWNHTHFVGFGIGAHVVGNAGRTLFARPARVTGLDPAGPLWDDNSNALNRRSGMYVEVIHTNGNFVGMMTPAGHADFYPNGGKNQPGCTFNFCSHERAIDLFRSSIINNHLEGDRCENLDHVEALTCFGGKMKMGNAISNKKGEGLYTVRTYWEYPY